MKKLPVRLRDVPPCPEGREYLVVAPYTWARDTDLLRAVRDVCDRIPRFSGKPVTTPARGPLVVYHVTPKGYVNELGHVCDFEEPIELASFGP